jgi:hypothetical protein
VFESPRAHHFKSIKISIKRFGAQLLRSQHMLAIDERLMQRSVFLLFQNQRLSVITCSLPSRERLVFGQTSAAGMGEDA